MSKAKAIEKKDYEEIEALQVKISVLALDTVENIMYGAEISELTKQVNEIANEMNFVGMKVVKNDIVYLFANEQDQKAFAEKVSAIVKCKALKTTTKVKRRVEQKATA